ncbi:hypothetical protein [Spiroplasma clarkii]|uniref:Uncharacterized protein n=1 Tax=Spiroplasma clarkii TaxID=2139 RepID=A0A2K8KMY7_9MOLU|nr:hypothetical protein [Spiroplasma clarkii]ATX70984.1 hypothetical protein SCLAR_v1c06670 [Spiroplasma clarkii]
MKLQEKIDLKNLVFEFYKADVKKLLGAGEFNISDSDKNQLLNLAKSQDIKVLYEGIKTIFENNLSAEQFDLSIMLTLLIQRYNYFYITEQEWLKYCLEVKDLALQDDLGLYIDYVAHFFTKQIDLYVKNYLEILQTYEVNDWNEKFYLSLKNLVLEIELAEDFVIKLEAMEQLVIFLQDTKNIYASLEGVGIEERKKEFLAHSNEVKIVFQSMDNLINQILLDLRK